MARVSPLMLAPPLVFSALAAMFYLGMQRADPEALPSQLIGKAAPPVALTLLGDGPPFTDATLRDGHVKLVNYWASWCAACRTEAPMLNRLAAQGVPIYGVDYKDRKDDALRFLAQYGSPFVAMGADRKGLMAIDWGVYGVPETYVIDGGGKVLLRLPGPITPDIWAKTIAPLLGMPLSG